MSEYLPNYGNEPQGAYGQSQGAVYSSGATRVPVVRAEPDPRLMAYAGIGEGAVVVSRPGDEMYGDNSLRQFFAMLLRRRGIFVVILALVLGATLAYLQLSPPIYVAAATMQVHAASANSEDSGTSSSLVVNGMPNADRSLGTQLTIIRSDEVRRAAHESLPPEVQAKLKGYSDTEIEPISETNLIEVKVGSHDPSASALYANAICDAYIQLSRAENRGQLQQAIDYVTMQKDKIGKKLEAARNQTQQYKERNGIFDVKSEAGSVVAAVRNLESEQEATQAERQVTQTELNTVSQMIPKFARVEQWPGSTTIRPEIAAMKSQITQLELKRLELLQKYRADRPEIKAIDLQIRSIRDEMQGQAKTEISSWSNNPNQIRAGLENQYVNLQVKNWSLQAKEAALAQAAQRAQARMALLPARERQMEAMAMDLKALTGSYSALNTKLENLRMVQEARMANAAKLFPAEPPRRPVGRMLRFLGSAMLVGLLLALALAALVDWLDDGVYSEAEAKMISQLPILAQIPQVGRDAQKSLTEAADTSTDDWQLAHLRENFRMLRTMIALSSPASSGAYALTAPKGHANGHSNGTNGVNGTNGSYNGNGISPAHSSPFSDSSIRSVVVTSSLPNEGKSVSATSLAIAAALSGEKVILVDCDLRHPGLNLFFDLPNDIGLTCVVSGACTLDEALQSTRIPTLRVLTTGPLMAEPLQVLNSAGARAVFEQLEEAADFVVIDTPPALVFAEAQVIAAMTDAMLLVISSQDAKKREVARTRDLFDQSGLMPLGAILNKIPLGPEGYYYGHYNQYSA